MSSICYEDTMGNYVKCLAEVKVKNIHCCHLMHRTSHLNIEGEEAGRAWFASSPSYWLSATLARLFVHYNEPFSFTKEDKTAFLDPFVHSLKIDHGQGNHQPSYIQPDLPCSRVTSPGSTPPALRNWLSGTSWLACIPHNYYGLQ